MNHILIADHQEIVRIGIRTVLESTPDFSVIGEVGNSQDLQRFLKQQMPDVLIFDVNMLNFQSRIKLVEDLKKKSEIKILVFSTIDDPRSIYELIQAGVDSYILKSDGTGHIVGALREIIQGKSYLSPDITTCFIEQARISSGLVTLPHERLTARELEVLQLIGQGLSNDEIASKLMVTNKTICNYASRVYDKLGVRDRVGAAIYARESHLVKEQFFK